MFRNQIKKIKDDAVINRVKDEFKALLKDPTLGKPLRYSLKGFRSIRIGKYRLIYAILRDVVRYTRLNREKGFTNDSSKILV
ncbi:MAG: type II toxin-antitoxin system RelE/ParE family toxin [Euryarchaeota archaeon]|nr:type II toxin-antitoxin system RelE/ParE family toxin [Euryarchaeota archaeon]